MRPPPRPWPQTGRPKPPLRRDAEALLPERFTSPEGPVKRTVSLLKTALAEESRPCTPHRKPSTRLRSRMPPPSPPRPGRRTSGRKRTAQRSALEAEARASAEEAARQSASAKALEAQCAEARAALPAAGRDPPGAGRAGKRALRPPGRDGRRRVALAKARQDYAAAEAAVTALTAQQTEAGEAADLPALESQRDAPDGPAHPLSRLRKRPDGPPPAQPGRDLYRPARRRRAELERRWQWVNALASTAGAPSATEDPPRATSR